MRFYVLFIIILICLTSCDSEFQDYYESQSITDITTNKINKTENTNKILGAFDYKPVSVSYSRFTVFNASPRGFIYSNTITSVYNPESGTANAICGDPLCSHLPGSGCPFQYLLFTGSAPEYNSDDGRLYYFMPADNKSEKILYNIYSAGLNGDGVKLLYSSKNAISLFKAKNDAVYFVSHDGDNLNLIHRIGIKDKKHTVIEHSPDELFISEMLCMDGYIVYITDDGSLYTCDSELKNIKLLMNLKFPFELLGNNKNDTVYYYYKNQIFEIDIKTADQTAVITRPEDEMIQSMTITDGFIYYVSVPVEAKFDTMYRDYAALLAEKKLSPTI